MCLLGGVCVCSLPPAAHTPWTDSRHACALYVFRISMNHTHTQSHTHRGLRGQRVSQSSNPML